MKQSINPSVARRFRLMGLSMIEWTEREVFDDEHCHISYSQILC